MPLFDQTSVVQFILKVSKLCNLRCKYCYEYPHLDDPAAMSLEQLEGLYLKLARHYAGLESPPEVQFVWHGGEPLLRPTSFYRETIRQQQMIFGGDLKVKNFIQTNLVSLDDDKIDLLKNFFDGVGVSVDLFGDLRVNLAGVLRQRAVLSNMDKLIQAGVDFGCIVVLSGANRHKLPQIFKFFEQMKLSFRVLPLFAGADPGQHGPWDISAADTAEVLCSLADLWFKSEVPIDVEPLSSHIRDVLRHRMREKVPHYHDRRKGESIVIVSTDGETYSLADAYKPGASWGNIFSQPLDELFAGEARLRSIEQTEQRMADACTRCEYFGGCSGHAVGEDNHAYRELEGEKGQCPVVRPLLTHLNRRLEEAGFVASDGFVDPAQLARRSRTSNDRSGPFVA
jgi:uncharacterized protein